MSRPVMVLLQDNLRLADNPAVHHAVESGRPILFLFVHDSTRNLVSGGATSWWLHHSLISLSDALKSYGHQLIIRSGDFSKVVHSLVKKQEVEQLYTVTPCGENDQALYASLEESDCECRFFSNGELLQPGDVMTQAGGPYKVFTPFYKAFLKAVSVKKPLAVPALSSSPSHNASSLLVDELGLEGHADWASEFSESWQPGEEGAQTRLNQLASKLSSYSEDRDLPATDGTSRMSPHLHFGEISGRTLWHAAESIQVPANEKEAYKRQLVWREFAKQLIHFFPHTVKDPLDQKFNHFPWRSDDIMLKAWQKGQTGYPIVDAGMRQLWQTGWMHNRVRMIVGSFLVKDLRIHWHEGLDWFHDTLVDADLANNVMGWQWIAGCGADAAPYFRVFNPERQSRKFDASGSYLRRWLPELAGLPDKWIHDPSTATDKVLQDAGIKLGDDYPEPIVNHAEERDLALEAYSEIKGQGA